MLERRNLRVALCTATLCVATPVAAHAQFGLVEGLFSTFTDIGLYSTLGRFEPRWTSPNSVATDGGGHTGFGIELLFSAGRITRAPQNAAPARDTVIYVPVEATVQRRGAIVMDSTTTYRIDTRRIAPPEETVALFELAIGYSEAGFHVTAAPAQGTAADAWEVRGAIRQLPSVTFYANFMAESAVAPYVGLRSGLARLSSLRAYGTDGTVLTGDAQAFQLGAVAGVAGSLPAFDNVSIFGEVTLMRRHFSSIEWNGDVPPVLPRDFRFRPLSFSAGLQVEFR